MKMIIQRVKKASVSVDQKIVGSIDTGLMLLLGIHKEDTEKEAALFIDKCIHLRIFPDDAGKMNRSLLDVSGDLLVVSQFTLYADMNSGRRPSFFDAAPPGIAEPIYDKLVALAKAKVKRVETGIFGAYMQVELVNDGPVTLIL